MGSDRTHNPYIIQGFSLPAFENRLRSILGVVNERPAGFPGKGSVPDIKDPAQFAKNYLIESLMGKFGADRDDPALDDAALLAFEEAERLCYASNLKFSQSPLELDRLQDGRLGLARQCCHAILGLPDMERYPLLCGFGPGASTRLKRSDGDAVYKYSGTPEVTANASFLGQLFIETADIWQQMPSFEGDNPRLNTVWGSRLEFVPKDVRKKRSIAIEPDFNMYLQKGVGGLIRRRLLNAGIDLRTQDRNAKACFNLGLATLDLSSASDTVSQGVVNYLLPPAWTDLIEQTRSEFIVYPDKSIHRLCKVSSMGNGFTFELETLIFLSLARACVPKDSWCDILVYGDDIIVPVACAPDLIALLGECGFVLNEEKSFFEGPFRESCGKHSHSGHDVTPFYIRRPIDNVLELFLLHNNLERWRRRVGALLTQEEDLALRYYLKVLRGFAPAMWRRPRLPDGYGDGAFIGSFAGVDPQVDRDGRELFLVDVLTEVAGDPIDDLPYGALRKWYLSPKPAPILWCGSDQSFFVAPRKRGRVRKRKLLVPWAAWS